MTKTQKVKKAENLIREAENLIYGERLTDNQKDFLNEAVMSITYVLDEDY